MKRHYTSGFYVGAKSETKAPSRAGVPTQKHSQQEQIHDYIAKQTPIAQDLVIGEVVSSNKVTSAHQLRAKYVPLQKKQLGCDTIFLKDGTVIAARVLEIGPRQIKYRYCSGPDQETRFLPKAALVRITYANGTSEKFDYAESIPTTNTFGAEPKMNGFALAGFILALATYPMAVIALFAFLSIVFGGGSFAAALAVVLITFLTWLLGLIFSIVGIAQISNDRTRYRGKGLAIAGLILALIPLLFFIRSLFH